MSKQTTSKKGAGTLLKVCLLVAGIFIASAVGGIIILMALVSEDSTTREEYASEEARRYKGLSILQQAVSEYHSIYKTYPTAEIIKGIKDDSLQKSLASGGVRYYTRADSEGKVCYVIQIIYDAKTNWSGRQFSNKPECIDLSLDTKPYKDGTYSNILDLH